jgi:hypothetical protein
VAALENRRAYRGCCRRPRVRTTRSAPHLISEIAVSVMHGFVTLNGMVLTLHKKLCASKQSRTSSCGAIANDIEVKLAEEMQEADEGIAERIARLLTWYSSLRNMDVNARVDDGHVTLIGEVDLLYHRHRIEAQKRRTRRFRYHPRMTKPRALKAPRRSATAIAEAPSTNAPVGCRPDRDWNPDDAGDDGRTRAATVGIGDADDH